MNFTNTEKIELGVSLKAIGCGQGGSNLIAAGNNIGLFEHIAAINTTIADEMSVPLANQIHCFNQDNQKRGAGRDAIKGGRLFAQNIDIVRERLGIIFSEGSEDAFYILSASLGGGSGNGMVNLLAKDLKAAMEDNLKPILGLMTFPEDSFIEFKSAKNTLISLQDLSSNNVYDSLFLVDNNKVYKKLPKVGSLTKINEHIWQPIKHAFTYIGANSTATMDVEDFEAIISCGRCIAIYETTVASDVNVEALRESILHSWEDENHYYVHSNPQRLMSDDYPYGFGLLIGAPSNIIERKRPLFERTFTSVKNILNNPQLSYKGFIPDDDLKDKYRIITIITGLPYPVDRIQNLNGIVQQGTHNVVDDTPNFLEGINRQTLIGQSKTRKTPKDGFDMLSLLMEVIPKKQSAAAKEEFSMDSLFALNNQPKSPKKGKLNFGSKNK